MYLYGLDFTVVTDHQPLVRLYNNPTRKGPVRVKQHGLKSQGYNFKIVYRKGSTNPTDYNSRYPLKISSTSEIIRESLALTTEVDLFVNTVRNQDFPDAMAVDMVQKATNQCDTMTKLKCCIMHKQELPAQKELQPYKYVFRELTITQQLVMRGERIVIPKTLISDVVVIAHEGHQGESKVSSLTCNGSQAWRKSLRWFP